MKLILSIVKALLLLGIFWSPLQAISWKTYTDSREVSALFAQESYLWAGTSGGVLRFAYGVYDDRGAGDGGAAVQSGGGAEG